MAQEPTEDLRDEAEEAPQSEKTTLAERLQFFRRFWTTKWLAIVLGISLLTHVVGITCSRFVGGAGGAGPNAEISLGEFEFQAGSAAPGDVVKASFSLHLALLEDTRETAGEHLSAHRIRVEQSVEELLRVAHSADFDDPALAELKRQLQETINESLGLRAIADVLITDLQMQRSPEQDPMMTETVESTPWATKPSG